MSGVDYLEVLRLSAPEAILVTVALAVLLADAAVLRELPVNARRLTSGLIAATGCVLTFGWIAAFPALGSVGEGMLVADSATNLVKQLILLLTLSCVLLAITDRGVMEHVAEFFAVLLFATVGMLFLVSSEQILMVFLALELTSLSLYVLAGFNKRSARSTEAGIKYFLFGGISAAFMLYGLSLVYGLTGATDLNGIDQALSGTTPNLLLLMAVVLIVIGFAFKVAAVPYHLWAPDVYQGAPLTSAALVASGSKVASFYTLSKVLMLGFSASAGQVGLATYEAGWLPLLVVMAAGSMLVGNFAALVQVSVRRLLAYSAIAHAGYMLLGVMSGQPGVAPLLYYVFTYGLATIGAFGVVSLVQERTGGDSLENFAGLARQAPVSALCMLIFLLSLAGIPPLAGFFGKFYLFAAALQPGSGANGLLWLVAVAIGLSAVSLYYYLQVLKQVYVKEAGIEIRFEVDFWQALPLVLLALAVLLLGCAPDLLLEPLVVAVRGVNGWAL